MSLIYRLVHITHLKTIWINYLNLDKKVTEAKLEKLDSGEDNLKKI